MKIINILTVVITVSSLLIASTSTVVAVDETRTITDDEDDVVAIDINTYTQEPYYYPNIDITEVKYEREDTNVTITITVEGDIENIGDIEDPYGIIVMYTLYLTTSFDMYTIWYMNNYCVLTTSYEEKNITDYSVEDSVLKINFDINNTDETYDSLAVDSAYMSMDLTGEDVVIASDAAGDLPLMVDASATSLGETGVEIEFIGYAEYGQSPYEYLWDFGDGSTSTEKNPSHIYNKAGTYNVTFTVTDDEGSEESYTGEIEIVGDDDNGTPGFELIIAIIAIGLIFLWKRKH